MHLVGFIVRIYRDARSPESQLQNVSYSKYARFMILKKMSLKIADCGLWGFGPYNFIYGTDVSAEPSDTIFRDFILKKEAAGFSEDTHTHTHAHTYTRTHTHSHTHSLTYRLTNDFIIKSVNV